MTHRLPTNCQRKLFNLWARLKREETINEITPLNRAELRGSVFVIHSHSSLTVLINDPQTVADELPTKIITFVVDAAHRRNNK